MKKTYTRCIYLAEALQKYLCLNEKGNKGYKERDWKERCLESS